MKRFLGFLLGGLCAGVVFLVLYTRFLPFSTNASGFVEKIELQTLNHRMQISQQPTASEAIKIVLVNDVANLGNKLAAFTNFISTTADGQYKPKVMGFNFLFDTDIVNEELVTAASLARNVYYGYYFLLPPLEQQPSQDSNRDIMPFRKEITDISDGIRPVLTAQDVQLPSARYLATARGIGFVNARLDLLDNVCRRIPLFLQFQSNWYGSLALLIAMEYLDIDSVDITFYPGQYFEIVQEDGSSVKIPVNQVGEMLIDFAYAPKEGGVAPFATYAIEDLLAWSAQGELSADQIKTLSSFKNSIVLVGAATHSTTSLFPIPLAGSYPLIGVHANVINNLLTNRFVRELRMVWVVGMIALISMLTGFILAGSRLIFKAIFGVLLAAIYAAIAYGVFYQFRIVLPIMAPLIALGLTAVIAGFVFRHPSAATSQAIPTSHPAPALADKKRKSVADDLSVLENQLLEIREEVDRKSFRLRSKVEELRVLQEQGEANQYDYSGQIAGLQKEIRAREIELKNLVLKEEELRRHLENLPFTEAGAAQYKQGAERVRQMFGKRGMLSNTESVLSVLARAEKFGKTSVTLLIQGEPGTGKNFLAKIIKELSPRHNRPVLEVICSGDMDLLEDDLFGHKRGAFPGAEENRNGYLRELDGGTIILEEVDSLSLEIQTRLFQALRGKSVSALGDDHGYPVDVRIIATTSQNLKELAAAGKFREDLYHYFSVFPLYLPPLRERKQDIPLLANYFVHKYNRVHSKIIETLSDGAINLLITHQWPGNVAELEKVIERAIAEVNPGVKELTERTISFEEADLTGGISDPGMLNYLIALMDPEKDLPDYQQLREKVLVEIQRLYCARLLRRHNGNVKNAAIDTGLKEDTFRKMLTELMIDPDNYQV